MLWNFRLLEQTHQPQHFSCLSSSQVPFFLIFSLCLQILINPLPSPPQHSQPPFPFYLLQKHSILRKTLWRAPWLWTWPLACETPAFPTTLQGGTDLGLPLWTTLQCPSIPTSWSTLPILSHLLDSPLPLISAPPVNWSNSCPLLFFLFSQDWSCTLFQKGKPILGPVLHIGSTKKWRNHCYLYSSMFMGLVSVILSCAYERTYFLPNWRIWKHCGSNLFSMGQFGDHGTLLHRAT